MGGNNINLRIKILIIDDELFWQKFYRKLLENQGYSVYEVNGFGGNVEEINTILSENSIDIILLDILMPHEIDGETVFNFLKEQYDDIPIIMLSVLGDSEKVRKYLRTQNKAYDYIVKSRLKDNKEVCEFFSVIEQALDYKINKPRKSKLELINRIKFLEKELNYKINNRGKSKLELENQVKILEKELDLRKENAVFFKEVIMKNAESKSQINIKQKQNQKQKLNARITLKKSVHSKIHNYVRELRSDIKTNPFYRKNFSSKELDQLQNILNRISETPQKGKWNQIKKKFLNSSICRKIISMEGLAVANALIGLVSLIQKIA